MGVVVVLQALFVAIAFSNWPIVGKYSGATGGWVGTMTSLGTLLAMASLSGRALTSLPQNKALLMLFVAGIINGLGLYVYSMKAADPHIATSIFVVTTAILMVVIAPTLDWGLNGAKFNAHQIAGFGVAAIAIYLLNR